MMEENDVTMGPEIHNIKTEPVDTTNSDIASSPSDDNGNGKCLVINNWRDIELLSCNMLK